MLRLEDVFTEEDSLKPLKFKELRFLEGIGFLLPIGSNYSYEDIVVLQIPVGRRYLGVKGT